MTVVMNIDMRMKVARVRGITTGVETIVPNFIG
jgi:hypothetical protein